MGTERAKHHLQATWDRYRKHNKDVGLLKLDHKAAFQMAKRGDLLQRLYNCPQLSSLYRFANAILATETALGVYDNAGRLVLELESQQGVRQGGSMSSLLYCLGMHEHYKFFSFQKNIYS